MNVQELIEVLGKAPPDMQVFVDGYENGYELLTWDMVRWVEVRKAHFQRDFLGEYSHVYRGEKGVKALLLSRGETDDEEELVYKTPMVAEPKEPLWPRLAWGALQWSLWSVLAGWVALMIYVGCCAP